MNLKTDGTLAFSMGGREEEETQLNLHQTELICMSVDKNYFSLLPVISNFQSFKIAQRKSKPGIR